MAKGSRVRDILWYLAIAALAFPVVPLFDHLGKPEFERPAGFALILLMLAVKVCGEIRSQPWFWATIMAIAGLHVPVLMLTAQWLSRMPFPTVLLGGVVDMVLILAIIGLVERLVGKRAQPVADSHSTGSHS